MEIRRVLLRKDGIKYVVIPKKSDIPAGVFVKIVQIDEKEEKQDGKRRREKGNS